MTTMQKYCYFISICFFALTNWRTSIVYAAKPQPNILSSQNLTIDEQHSIYIWIYLNGTDPKTAASTILQTVDKYSSSILAPTVDPVSIGVGFGFEFYKGLSGKDPSQNFVLETKKGQLGEMPGTGGDIFIHGKSNDMSKLVQLFNQVVTVLPGLSPKYVETTYGFTYQKDRDLSGFIDGTGNPYKHQWKAVAVDEETGGSYALTQKWVHNFDVITSSSDSVLESYVGRTRKTGDPMPNRPKSSHVGRVAGIPLNTTGARTKRAWPPPPPGQGRYGGGQQGGGFRSAMKQKTKMKRTMQAKPPPTTEGVHLILRQSKPFYGASGEAGLFFIAFGDVDTFEVMLDRMVGKDDGIGDDIMRISRAYSGNYWFFPSVEELAAYK